MTVFARTMRRAGVVIGTALALTSVQLLTGDMARAEPSHGLSIFGELKYPADFKHFAYANPQAPKGGAMSMIGTSGLNTFDSFNTFLLSP